MRLSNHFATRTWSCMVSYGTSHGSAQIRHRPPAATAEQSPDCRWDGLTKTHTMSVVGVAKNGITLVIINIYNLTANQMANFVGVNQDYGTIKAHNVDKIFQKLKKEYSNLLHRERSLPVNTTSTLFSFVLPRFMCYHLNFTSMLIGAVDRNVLCLVGPNKVHLRVQQGNLFCPEIRMFKNIFFNKAYHKSRQASWPKKIMDTKTSVRGYIHLVYLLTGIGLPPSAIRWASPADFKQRNMKIKSQLNLCGTWTLW